MDKMLIELQELFERPLAYGNMETGESFNRIKELWQHEAYKSFTEEEYRLLEEKRREEQQKFEVVEEDKSPVIPVILKETPPPKRGPWTDEERKMAELFIEQGLSDDDAAKMLEQELARSFRGAKIVLGVIKRRKSAAYKKAQARSEKFAKYVS